MSTYYISTATSSCGQAMCGLAMCGIYGFYNYVPTGVVPGMSSFPDEYLPILIELNGTEIYPAKGTLNWNESINGSGESTCSFSYVGTVSDRPQSYMSVKIGIGSMANLLFSGVLLSFDEEYFGGNSVAGTLELQYNLNATNFSHYFARKVISYSGFGMYAGDMIKEILSTYFIGKLTIGTIEQGIYFSLYTAENETVSSIFQKITQDSELALYVTPEGVVHARTLSSVDAYFDLSHTDEYVTGEMLPTNNFANTKISEDASQIITRIHLHATDYTKHTVTYVLESAIGDPEVEGRLSPQYKLSLGSSGIYFISPGQTTFYTDEPIGYVVGIDVLWVSHNTNSDDYSHYKWIDPLRGDFRSKGGVIYVSGKGLHMELGQQYTYINENPFVLTEREGGDSSDSSSFSTVQESFYYPHSRCSMHWALRDTENGKSILEVQEASTIVIDDPAFDWTINYDSNTIQFNGDIEFGEEIGQIQFLSVSIEFYEQKDIVKTFNDTVQQAAIQALQGNDDGIIEQHIEQLELTSYAQQSEYAQAFFNLRSDPLLTCSYSHIINGSRLLTNKLEPGMSQNIGIYGRNEDLMIESIKYSLRVGAIPELQMEVSLATQQRDLANLVKRMITGR